MDGDVRSTEACGWKEQERIASIQVKYLSCVLNLDKDTPPRYIVMKETKTNKMRVEMEKRAVRYDEKM